jgi:hypothetical protein
MRTNLKGLFRNIKSELRPEMRDFYGFALDEVYQHLIETVEGQHTLTQFADHYCLKPAAGKSEST